jgi:Amt family ammonium transporter
VQRRLHELIVDTKMHRTPHTLLYVDLDRFKTVNDRCGHLAGDALLRQLAGLFKRHVRNGDLVARLGGDEFCVGLVNCQSEQALRIAEAIRAEIEQHRFVWEGQEFDVGASIGLVEIDASMDVERALQAADAACYRAKEQGRNRVCVH